MDLGLAPLEGYRVLVIARDERVDRLAQLMDRREAGAIEGAAGEYGEPDLDLVEPGGVGRGEVEVDVLVPCQPQIPLRLVGLEVVEDHVDLPARVIGDHVVHEVEELEATPALAVLGLDRAGRDLEGGEQRGRSE